MVFYVMGKKGGESLKKVLGSIRISFSFLVFMILGVSSFSTSPWARRSILIINRILRKRTRKRLGFFLT